MKVNDYVDKQKSKDVAYAREYQRWIQTLSPEERKKLAISGLDSPLIQNHGNGHSDKDLAESPLASETPDIIGEIEPHESIQNGQPVTDEIHNEHTWDAVRRILGEILSQKNRSLTVECLALAAGLSYTGDSMTDIAKRHYVTRAAVSKRCIELTEKLKLPPSRAMKSLTARQSYKHAQLKNSSKNELIGHHTRSKRYRKQG